MKLLALAIEAVLEESREAGELKVELEWDKESSKVMGVRGGRVGDGEIVCS